MRGISDGEECFAIARLRQGPRPPRPAALQLTSRRAQSRRPMAPTRPRMARVSGWTA